MTIILKRMSRSLTVVSMAIGIACVPLTPPPSALPRGVVTVEPAPPPPAQPKFPGVAPIPARAPRDPFQIGTLAKVFYYVQEDYYDPARVDPSRILLAALEAVEREVDDLQVTVAGREITLRTPSAEKRIAATVKDLDEAVLVLRTAFEFLRTELAAQRDGTALEYAAIRGALETLDDGSSHLHPEVYDEMKLSTSGNVGGLGIVMAIRNGGLTVIAPIEGTPSHRMGVKAGDKILSIDGIPTLGMSTEDAVQLLRGPVGTVTRISVRRPGSSAPIEISGPRETIKIRNVTGGLLDRIAYVRVKGMQEETAADVRSLLRDLESKLGSKPDGIVLDLRGCPGGLLDESVALAGLFLDRSLIVGIVGSRARNEKVSRGGGDTRTPLAVLVDPATAAGAEIVASALIDHDRGIVIGERTNGRGTIQNLFDLRDDSALKLTIGEDLRPNGTRFDGVGVTPDVEVAPLQISPDVTRLFASQGDPLSTRERAALRLDVFEESAPPPVNAEFTGDRTHEPAVRFAATLLRFTPGGTRKKLLQNVPQVLATVAPLEQARIDDAFKKVGVDWSHGKTANAKLSLSATGGPTRPGESVDLAITVTNTGTSEANRVHLLIRDMDASRQARVERGVGKLAPGQSSKVVVKWEVGRDAPEGSAEIAITAHSDRGPVLAEARHVLAIQPPPRVALSTAWEIFDPPPGNEDGTLQANEEVEVLFRVRNEGAERVEMPVITLSSLQPAHARIARRFAGGDPMAKSGTMLGRFRLRAGAPGFPSLSFRAKFGDASSSELAELLFTVPIVAPGRKSTPRDFLAMPAVETKIAGGSSTSATSARIDVTASAPGGVRDVWARVDGDKTFYERAKDGSPQAAFSIDVPLKAGPNRVEIFVRGADGTTVSRRLSIVRTAK